MTYSQIQSLFYQLTGTNSTSLPAATLNFYTQPAEDEVAADIMQCDSRWQYDDGNQSDLPIATTTITSGQADYSLATSHLTLDRVELLPSGSSTWNLLIPIDQHDISDQALTTFQSTSGTPIYYDKVGNTIFLYPTPNYTQGASLKLYFTRGPLKFDYSTGQFTDSTGSTSSNPGFNSLFHSLIAYKAAENFGIAKGLKNLPQLQAKIAALRAEMYDFYGERSRDERPRFEISYDSNQ